MTRDGLDGDLAMARNNGGGRLTDLQKDMIRAYIEMPTAAMWDACFNMVLVPPKKRSDGSAYPAVTLWQAVTAMDPTFPSRIVRDAKGARTWDRLPGRELVAQALRYATH